MLKNFEVFCKILTGEIKKKHQINTIGTFFSIFPSQNFAGDSIILQESVKIVILSHSAGCTQFILHEKRGTQWTMVSYLKKLIKKIKHY